MKRPGHPTGQVIPLRAKPAATICVRCIYHHCSGDDIWYNHFCRHPRWLQIPKAQDPVNGRWGYQKHNSVGDAYLDETPWPHCREVNKGNCDLYCSFGAADDTKVGGKGGEAG